MSKPTVESSPSSVIGVAAPLHTKEKVEKLTKQLHMLRDQQVDLRSDFINFQTSFKEFQEESASTLLAAITPPPKTVVVTFNLHMMPTAAAEGDDTSPTSDNGEPMTDAQKQELTSAVASMLGIPVVVNAAVNMNLEGSARGERMRSRSPLGFGSSSPRILKGGAGGGGGGGGGGADSDVTADPLDPTLKKNIVLVLAPPPPQGLEKGESAMDVDGPSDRPSHVATFIVSLPALNEAFFKHQAEKEAAASEESGDGIPRFTPLRQPSKALVNYIKEICLVDNVFAEDSRTAALHPDPKSVEVRAGTKTEDDLLFPAALKKQSSRNLRSVSPMGAKATAGSKSPLRSKSPRAVAIVATPPPMPLLDQSPAAGQPPVPRMAFPPQRTVPAQAVRGAEAVVEEQQGDDGKLRESTTDTTTGTKTTQGTVLGETPVATQVRLISQKNAEKMITPTQPSSGATNILPSSHRLVAQQMQERSREFKGISGVLPDSVFHQATENTRSAQFSTSATAPPSEQQLAHPQHRMGAHQRPNSQGSPRLAKSITTTYGANVSGIVAHKWALPAVVQRWDLGNDTGSNTKTAEHHQPGRPGSQNSSPTREDGTSSPTRVPRSVAGLSPRRTQEELLLSGDGGPSSARGPHNALQGEGHGKTSSSSARGARGNNNNNGLGPLVVQATAPTIPCSTLGKQREAAMPSIEPGVSRGGATAALKKQQFQLQQQRGMPYRVPSAPTFTGPSSTEADAIFVGSPQKGSAPPKENSSGGAVGGPPASSYAPSGYRPRPSTHHGVSRNVNAHAHQGRLSGMFDSGRDKDHYVGGGLGGSIGIPPGPGGETILAPEDQKNWEPNPNARLLTSGGGSSANNGRRPIASIPFTSAANGGSASGGIGNRGGGGAKVGMKRTGDGKTLNLIMREVKTAGGSRKQLQLSSLDSANANSSRMLGRTTDGVSDPSIPRASAVISSVPTE